jgi:hypothetical protein
VTDYHVITAEAAELVMQVIDGQLVIVEPQNPAPQPIFRAPTADVAHPAE